MKKLKVITLLLAMTFIAGNLTSCIYEDGPKLSLRTKTARLTGVWDFKTFDGEKVGTYGESISVEFEKGGKLTSTVKVLGISETETGTWKWVEGKEKIETESSGDKDVWEITRLTNKELQMKDTAGKKYELEKI